LPQKLVATRLPRPVSIGEEPEHLKRWWGPRGWELPVCNIDLRPGGVWHYCMKCVDQNQGEFYGMESWGKQVYKEIVVPQKIVYTDYFSDAEGNVNDALPSTEGTVEFIDLGGRTKIVSRSECVSAEALRTVMDMRMLQGVTDLGPAGRAAERGQVSLSCPAFRTVFT
jgi:uncharacterized protein YndB with AHSA1/START domain